MTTKVKNTQINPIPASASNSALTGTPTAPTPSVSDDSTKIATTAYLKDNLENYSTTSEIESTYLPLSGGTLTGSLIGETPTHRIFSLFNHGTGDDNFTNIDFGWNYANRDGAGAAFRSVDSTISGEAGAFVFYTRNSSSNYTLAGKCDGTLTWSGTTVKITSACNLQYNSTNKCIDFIFS